MWAANDRKRSAPTLPRLATLTTMIRAVRASARSGRRRSAPLAVAALAAAALIGLSGCAPETPTTTERPTSTQPPTTPEPAPEFFPDGSAEDNLPYFAHVLSTFSAGGEAVEGQPVVDAVAAAGFDRAAMQVSYDRTKTDLVADNIFVSVRIGADCLIGQIVTADRSTFAVTEPAVGPDQSICLIGATRPIDW